MFRMIPGARVPLAALVVATVASLAATPVPPDQASPAAGGESRHRGGKGDHGGGMHGRAAGAFDCRRRRSASRCEA